MIAPQRADIFHIDVLEGEAMGHELIGPHAWVILSIGQLNQALGLFTAVPLTSVINKITGEPKDKGEFRHFRIKVIAAAKHADPGVDSALMNGDSIALTEQIRVFSSRRLTGARLGTITPAGLAAIELGMDFVFGRRIVASSAAQNAGPETSKKAALEFPKETPRMSPGKPLR